jgi:glycosyltransferase involved in cell wall biosynthesis
MKIVFWIPSLETGGAERQLVVLANGLAARGHRVSVITAYGGGDLEAMLNGPELIGLNKRGRWDLVGFSFRCVQTVRRLAPDILYTFLGTPNILSSFLGPFMGGARRVWGVRASDMDLSRYDWGTKVAAKLEVLCARTAHAIIVNSEAGMRHAARRGMPQQRMIIVRNGIDTGMFRPDRASGDRLRALWHCDDDIVLVGVVGRLDPMKDHETFITAAALVRDRDIRFVCVGQGDESHAAMLRQRAEEAGLAARLVWAGRQDDMPSVYNALDICCLSSMTEGFPNVLGEAMACGVPCVTTDVGDAAMIVGDTGIVVPPSNPEELADGLIRMASRVRSEDVPDVRSSILSHFSVERMVQATEDVLKAAL